MYEEEKFETEELTKGMFSIEVTKLICTLEIAVKIQHEDVSTPRKIINFDQVQLMHKRIVLQHHPLMLMPPVCCCLSAAACLLQFDKFDKVSFISVNKRCFIEENSFPLSVAFVGNFLPDWGRMPCK
ncbi:hypothetical protein T4B_3352 [Trichinella pseudospiralis]|uniref:Uncharacterized protein n=1 Tax=Trichinella pseudospiralis TaxID=6337 RepID=A0A0V1GLK1_TRIPS|nr:hypothetical protein T4B_3352 [Trichinella pseudospiralis]